MAGFLETIKSKYAETKEGVEKYKGHVKELAEKEAGMRKEYEARQSEKRKELAVKFREQAVAQRELVKLERERVALAKLRQQSGSGPGGFIGQGAQTGLNVFGGSGFSFEKGASSGMGSVGGWGQPMKKVMRPKVRYVTKRVSKRRKVRRVMPVVRQGYNPYQL